MTKPYTLVVFDWEGTLSDTLGLIINTVGDVAEASGLARPDPGQAMTYASYGLVMAIRKLYPQLNEQALQQLIHEVQRSLSLPHEAVFLLPGAAELVQQLHREGIDLAVATNKGERSLQRALQQSGLAPCFTVTRSAGQTPAKPHPQMLEEILDISGKRAEDALMIGDSPSDIEMAKSVCMDAIGVDFYQQQHDILLAKGAMAVFDNYDEVAEYILQQPL